jgi:hypothetical protein
LPAWRLNLVPGDVSVPERLDVLETGTLDDFWAAR